MNVQESTNYVTLLSKVNKSDITNVCSEENTIKENSLVQMGITQYESLNSWYTLSTKCKTRYSYNNHSIIIIHGFKHGVDFNISCRKWNMLRSKEWIIDNVMNRALDLLQQRNISNGKNYWIFNMYKMEYLMGLKLEQNVIATIFYKIIPGGNIFQYENLCCTCNIGNIHWTLVIINFKEKSIKYLDGKKLDGTEYIGYVIHWLELEHMRLYNTNLLWDTWTVFKTYEKCANQENSYDCGQISIRFIGLDILGASLQFTHDMVKYRENIQYSIASVTYDYLGMNKTMIPMFDTFTDKAQHLHDGNGSQINDNKNISVYEDHVEVTRDEETKNM